MANAYGSSPSEMIQDLAVWWFLIVGSCVMIVGAAIVVRIAFH
nr:hypothetical protein [Mucilaginibacter sp. SP1R1]